MGKPSVMKILIGVIIILLVLAVIIFAFIISNKNGFSLIKVNNNSSDVLDVTGNTEIKAFYGNNRPIAIMIDNNKNAWPQSSINDAYMVYEILVEAGETRMMALFKNTNIDVVGPVRSSRHYFLDYALENDAIYTHLGWSPQAESDIRTLGVNNINGQYYDSGKARTDNASFWRLGTKSAPHNAMTNIPKLLERAKSKGYRLTSSLKSVLPYVKDEVNLEGDMIANTITIPFSSSNTVKFTYDKTTKRYTKYAKGVKQTDLKDNSDITCKNIIITFAKNYTLTDVENKGRQGLKNIGNLNGYYITNGKAIAIECIKNSRSEQTIYKDINGNEIKVNDGNTFVEICPLNANVIISDNE